MRRLAILCTLLLSTTVGVSAAGAAVGPLSLMSGPTPFSPGCEGTPQTGTNYPNAEVEPWVEIAEAGVPRGPMREGIASIE